MTSIEMYSAFMPPGRAENVHPPEETWWEWRGHRVHVARRRRSGARVRLLVIHGAGGHSGALWPLVSQLTDCDADIAAVDLPLFGRTFVPDPAGVRYELWLELLGDLVAAEDDGRPLILFGASIGGMLAFETSARSRSHQVAAVAATSLLNPRDRRVQVRLTRFGWFGLLAVPLSHLARGWLARVMVPMRWVANLQRMSLNPALSLLCAQDSHGGGSRVPVGFLASYLRYRHIAPQTATTPVLLLHPGRDTWTPPELSIATLGSTVGPSQVVILRECGHFPVEEPGLTDLVESLRFLIHGVGSASKD